MAQCLTRVFLGLLSAGLRNSIQPGLLRAETWAPLTPLGAPTPSWALGYQVAGAARVGKRERKITKLEEV